MDQNSKQNQAETSVYRTSPVSRFMGSHTPFLWVFRQATLALCYHQTTGNCKILFKISE